MADLETDLDYGELVNVSNRTAEDDEELGYRILKAVESWGLKVDLVLLIASALAVIVGNAAEVLFFTYILLRATVFDFKVFFCLLMSVVHWGQILSLFSMWSTGCLWFLETIKPELFRKYPKIPLYVLGFIHLMGATTSIILLSIDCFEYARGQLSLFITIFYFVAVVVIIGINIVACRKPLNNLQLSTKYHLTVATYVVLSYFPSYVSMLFDLYGRIGYEHPIATIYLIVTFVCGYISTVISVIVVSFLLRKYSADLKIAYSKLFSKVKDIHRIDSIEDFIPIVLDRK